MVVNRNRQATLGHFLTNNVAIEKRFDFLRRRQLITNGVARSFPGFLANDIGAQVNTLIANEHLRTRNKLSNLMLAFVAKRAMQHFLVGGSFFFCHKNSLTYPLQLHRPNRTRATLSLW